MGIAKAEKSLIERKSKPRGRPPKTIKYIYKNIEMDHVRKIDELKTSGNLSENWRIFWQNFQIFATAIELEKKKGNVKVAIFLNTVGPDAVELFNTFSLTEEQKEDYAAVTKAFDEFCKPKCNEVYETFMFSNRCQVEGEPFDNFLMDLKKMVRRCGFSQEDRMVRDRIVLGTNDKKLQKKLLDTPDLTMDKAVQYARAAEASNQQMVTLQGSREVVNFMKKSNGKGSFKKQHDPRNTQDKSESKTGIFNCTYCGNKHVKGKCPAFGKMCKICKRKNHFANVCKFKNVQEVKLNTFDSNSSLYLDSILSNHNCDTWYENIQIGNENIKFKLDTGASINVLPFKYVEKIGMKTYVQNCSDKLVAYNGTKIPIIGVINLNCNVKQHMTKLNFYVTSDINNIPILGLQSCVDLKLIKRIFNIELNENILKTKYEELFRGIGCIKDNFTIELKNNVIPVAKPARRIPLTLREPLKLTLDRMCTNDIIEKCENPGSWISNLVVVEKPNKSLRICMDPKELNLAIRDKFYEIPKFEQIKPKLVNKKFFSVFDLKDGFWQVALSEKSKELCTFSTPFGCYRFKRLPFGIKIAPEAFQKINEENFAGIDNIIIYIDDILVVAENEKEHDKTVSELMERALKHNVKFNWNKIQWKRNEVMFLGHKISGDGIECDKNRLKGIEDIGAPKCKKDLQRLMGFINYLRDFIPNLAEVSNPLRELMKNSVVFNWTTVHENSLKSIKNLILKAPSLKPFDHTKQIVIQTDASKNGLGCALMQENRPVCFASRSLSDAETRYAQIEKEMLAIVFACDKYHDYIYGQNVKIVTDHKPLLGIMNKDYNKIPSMKLRRMKLKLEKYKLNLSYLPGKYMYLADWLSRSFDKKSTSVEEIKGLGEMIHSINVSEDRKNLIQKETQNDKILSNIIKYCNDGWPKEKNRLPEQLRFLWKLKSNLFVEDNLVFFEDRIYLPKSLTKDILIELHKPHLGYEKTKSRAKQILYWPSMNNDIELMIDNCKICQRFRYSNIKEPLINHKVPDLPYEKLGMDIMEISKEIFLVVGDYFSKYLDIIPLNKKTASAVTQKLDVLFSCHGLPKEIIADNVPFGSYEFVQWAKKLDIKVTTTSPRYPRSNGFAEKMVQIAKKLVMKTKAEKSNIWLALLEYRNSPIKNSNLSPSQILMGRSTRTLVPSKNLFFYNNNNSKVKATIEQNNKYNKKYHDQNSKQKDEFAKGEKIWVKDDKHWQEAKVIQKHKTPRSYIIDKDGVEYRRNSYFLRKRK